jgi:plasmid stabilization system protein ParE
VAFVRAVKVTPIARAQIEEALSWWAAHGAATAESLDEELGSAFRLIARVPRVGSIVSTFANKGVRCFQLRRSQYRVYYRLSTDERTVEVLAR